jgi:hypothetical protein
MGMMLGPANTDAINRAPRTSYGEATGVTQTVRNYGSALGMAVLGTVLLTVNKSRIESSLGAFGIPTEQADAIANSLMQGGSGGAGSMPAGVSAQQADEVFGAVQLDFAHATQVVFYVMAGVMAVAFVAALVGLQAGRQEAVPDEPEPSTSAPAPA